MSACDLTSGSISLLVKEHLLPASEGEEWVSPWTTECPLQAGAVLRIPYDPETINQTEVQAALDSPPAAPLPPSPPPPAPPLADPPAGVPVHTPLDEDPITETNMPPESDTPAAPIEAHEGVADPTGGLAGELTGLAQTTGADASLTIILALVAVLGGGAAWKFYRQHSEQKHEQEMQKLKMEAKAKGMEGQSPGPCQTVHTQLKAEVEELKSRLDKMDKKMSLSADFDGEDLERKVRKLERWRRSLEDDEDDV